MFNLIKDILGWLFSRLAERCGYSPQCPVCGSCGVIKVAINLPTNISRPDDEPLFFDVYADRVCCLDCGYTYFDERSFYAALRFERDVQKAVDRLYRRGGTVRLPSESERQELRV